MVEENANSESDDESDAYLAEKFSDDYGAEMEVSIVLLHFVLVSAHVTHSVYISAHVVKSIYVVFVVGSCFLGGCHKQVSVTLNVIMMSMQDPPSLNDK